VSGGLAETLVVLDAFETETSCAADVVLPIAATAECGGTWINLAAEITQAHSAVRPPGNARQGWQALLDLGAGCDGACTMQSLEEVRRELDDTGRLGYLARARGAATESPPGRATAERRETEMGRLLRDAVEEARRVADAKGVTLLAEVPADLGTVVGDRAALRQMLDNVIGNAIRYTPAGGRVAVRAAADAAGLLFEVEDTGIGIPPDDLPRVFDEFFRSANARAHAREGTGLGLAIVRAVAEQHGGAIAIASAVGEGTRVTVNIPSRRDCL
jgi:signal transduction histidine kinase